MKKNFIYLLLFFSLIAQAQVTPSYPTIKLTKTVEGVKQDSLLVVGTDKIVKHIPYSKISNVQEYATASALPLTGVAGKLYITKDNNKIYTWNGTFYSEFFGAKGEKGDQGIQGIQGVAGTNGAKGDKGDVGLTGSIGLTGAKGDKGDIGLTGLAGTNGLDGAKGDTGAKGDKGDQGIQGFKGDTGLTGADGAIGVQGPQGIQGIQGETGLRGIQGEIGPQGSIGFTGEKGADGTGVSIKGSFDNTSQLPASGADGDAYLISGNLHVWNGTAWVNVGNIQGPQGLIGLTGATGSQGIQGVKGDKGDQGIQGIQGLKGDTGAKGDTGSFNGDITADQVTETATRKFQTPTQSAYNDATSSIQGQLNDKPSKTGVGATGTWGINISGTAANSTLWNGINYDTAFQDQPIAYILSRDGFSDTYKRTSDANVKSWLGLGSNAYTSTVIPTDTNQLTNGAGYITDVSGKVDKVAGKSLIADSEITRLSTVVNQDISNKANKDGTNATGTWGINISGNASKWGGVTYNDVSNDNTDYFVTGQGGGIFNYSSKEQVRTSLGLGSNAYTSTVIPTNTNQLINGAGYITDISGKVDKVAGKSLIADTEITRLATVTNQDISGKFDKTGGTISGNTSVTGTVTASGGFFNSDRRLKNIFKRDGDVAYYTWKDGRDDKEHIGYVAQEVQENHPNQVQEDEKGILSVNYVEILVEKIRVLEKRIEQLEKSK